jgi:uncharacterized protein YndB with AHSA1/START domain
MGGESAPITKEKRMEDIRDEIVVNASIERVWKAIQDTKQHEEWHPFLTRIVGEHTLGGLEGATCS